MDQKFAPNKDIASAIHNACFDYKPFEMEVEFHDKETIEQRIYNCWQLILQIAKNDPEWFMKMIEKMEPDLSYYNH